MELVKIAQITKEHSLVVRNVSRMNVTQGKCF